MNQIPDDGVSNDPQTQRWHLDRRIPVAQLTFIGLQCLAMVWWAAKMDSRVEILEHGFASVPARLETVARLEVKVDYLSQQLAEVRTAAQAQLDDLKKAIGEINKHH